MSAKNGSKEEKAVFAGGCFWCMVPPFENLEGVKRVVSGYTGGTRQNPTYEEVSSGKTGHLEAVEIVYDPAVISYEKLLEVFWDQIDPTDLGGQFADRGPQYLTAIFYLNEDQKKSAERSREAQEGRFGKTVVTKILPAGVFYPAEEYHQQYHKKNPACYKAYRSNSGRGRFLKAGESERS